MEEELIPFSLFYDDAIIDNNITHDMAEEYRSGTEKRLKSYVEQKYPKDISYDNGETLVSRDFFDDAEKEKDIKDYFQYKEGTDFSAKDTAKRLLTHIGIPPIEAMSPESLEKKVRALFDTSKYKDSVYVKRSGKKGVQSIGCIDLDTVQELERDKRVQDLIRKQINRVEQDNKDSDSVAMKLYNLEKNEIDYNNEQFDRYSAGQEDDIPGLSLQEKTRCMLQELFSLFFTDTPFYVYELHKDLSNIT